MRGFAISILVLAAFASPAAAGEAPLDFAFSYPPQVAAIPELRAWFDTEKTMLRSASLAEAVADQRDAAKEQRPFHAYTTDRTWKVVTDTPRFLSLSMEGYDYTGGAHGNTAFASLVWDKKAKARRTTMSFFTSAEVLRVALGKDFCRRLDAERDEKRSGGDTGGLPEFDKCIDATKQAVILGSSTRKAFDRIGILIPPYEAGPYSDGTYEVTMPVNAAIIAAVKPEWRSYFAARAGSRGTP